MSDDFLHFESPFLRYLRASGAFHLTSYPQWGASRLDPPQFPTRDESFDAGYKTAIEDILDRFGAKHFDQHGLPLDMELTMWAAQKGITLSDEKETDDDR